MSRPAGPGQDSLPPDLYVYVVDASDDAVGSHDFGGSWDDACGGSSRLDIQRGLLLPADSSDAPGELCVPLRGAAVKVALVLTAHSKATVALGPTTDADALKSTLRDVRCTPRATGGASNLRAALCLALLVARGASRPKITAFVGGPLPGFAQSDAEEVRSRAGDAALSVCVLASRGEVGDAVAAALETLPCGGGSLRWLEPPGASESKSTAEEVEASSEELWALKEASGAEPLAVRRPEPAQSDSASPVPPLAPRGSTAATRGTTARGPLPRSAFSCRDSSLDTLLHLSRSGLLRQKLPTYSTLAGRVRGAATVAGGGLSSGAGDCYVRVLAQPRYRTLVRLDVGRWCDPARPMGPSAGWAPGALRIVQDLKTPSSLLVVGAVDGDASSGRPGPQPLEKAGSSATDAPLDLWATSSTAAATLADLRISVQEMPPTNPVTFENFEYWVSGGPSPFQVALPLEKGSSVTVRDLQAQDSDGKTRPGRLVSFIMPMPAAVAARAAKAAAAAGRKKVDSTEAGAQQRHGRRRFSVWIPAPEGQQQGEEAAKNDVDVDVSTDAPDAQAAGQEGGASLPARLLRCAAFAASNLDAAASKLLFLSPFLLSFTATLTARLVGGWRAQASSGGHLEASQTRDAHSAAGTTSASAATSAGATAVPTLQLPLDTSAFFKLSSATVERALCSTVSSPPHASFSTVVSALRAAGKLSAIATIGPVDAATVALMVRYQAAAAEQQAAWDALKDRVAAPPGAPQAAAAAGAAGSPQFVFRGSVPQRNGAISGETAVSATDSGLQHVTEQGPQQERASDAAAGLEVDSSGPDAVLVAKAGEDEVKLPLTPSAARDPPSLGSEAAAPPPPPAD